MTVQAQNGKAQYGKAARDVHACRRSGRHRRSAFGRAMAVASDWFHQPYDYEWILRHRSVRHLHTVIRGSFGTATLVFAAVSMVMLFSPRGPASEAARVWIIAVMLLQVGVAFAWFYGPLPSPLGAIAFGVFGDVGLASVLITYDPLAGLIGSVLFVVTGAYFTFFMSPRWLVAHLVFSCAVIAYIGLSGWSTMGEALATTIAGGAVILAAVGWIPLFAHIAWTAIAGDARRSARDPLTGLLNRRGLDNEIGDLWDFARSSRSALAVVMIDIDKFKRVNDVYGHDAGDRVLVDVAHRLTSALGPECVVARTGGEEFVAIMPGDRRQIERRVASVTDIVFDDADPVPVTVSAGAAFLDAGSSLAQVGRPVVERMLKEADHLMYRSKTIGGNCLSTVNL